MSESVTDTGGYSHKVTYNESPWPNRYGYTGVCRRGAHLFTNEADAKKFMVKHFLREPRLMKWVTEKRFEAETKKVKLVGRWK